MSDTDALAPALEYLLLCVQRYVHRYGFRMVQASGTLSQLYVSLDEARAMLSGPGGLARSPAEALGLPPLEGVEAALVEAALRLDHDTSTPLTRLGRRFGLSPTEVRLFLAAAGPYLSVDLARLYGFAWADFAVKLPSVGFLCELLASRPLDATVLRDAFSPKAPLVRYRLVELRDAAAWGSPTPLLHKGVVVPDAVLAHLRGQFAELPTGLASAARLIRPREATPAEGLFCPETVQAELFRSVAQAAETGFPRLFVVGPEGVGRRTCLASAAASVGLGTLAVDLKRLSEGPDFGARLAEAAREAVLRGCLLVLKADELLEERELWTQRAPDVSLVTNGFVGPLAFTAHQPVAGLHHAVDGLFDLVMPMPSAPSQRLVWSRALRQEGSPEDAALANYLARRFTVTPGTVFRAVREARDRRKLEGGALTVDDVAHAVRRRLDHTLSQVAEPFTTSLDWDDVVLPTDVRETLQEILAHARHRERVFDDWGFRRKMSYGRGLACLFSGPPGTGKTMMAAIIAKTLGQELYRVDLSRIVSKWVGETEKNLARVFDEAERAQVILLFDEADSLFSSRTEVKGSNDRHANMEINYLLQRMESYDGMSLLTTNFEKSIDEAFKRRIKFKVNFPMPEPEERAKLWQAMLPVQALVADDIKYELLGKKYKLAGGNIKNAVLRAAFYAAEAGTAIDHALLDKAAVAESRDMGRLI